MTFSPPSLHRIDEVTICKAEGDPSFLKSYLGKRSRTNFEADLEYPVHDQTSCILGQSPAFLSIFQGTDCSSLVHFTPLPGPACLTPPAASSTTSPPGPRPPSANSCRSRLSNSTRAVSSEGVNDSNSVGWSPIEEAMFCIPTPNQEHALLCPSPEDELLVAPSDHPVELPGEEQQFVPPKQEELPAMPDEIIDSGGDPDASTSFSLGDEKMFQRKAFIDKLRLDAGGGVHWAASLDTNTSLEGPSTARGDPPGSGTPAWTPSSGTFPSFLRASTPKARDSCRTPGFPNPFTPGPSFSFPSMLETPMGGSGSFDVFPSPAGYQKTVKSVTDEMMAEDDVARLSRTSF